MSVKINMATKGSIFQAVHLTLEAGRSLLHFSQVHPVMLLKKEVDRGKIRTTERWDYVYTMKKYIPTPFKSTHVAGRTANFLST